MRKSDIRPAGVETPILYGLNELTRGLIPRGRKVPASAVTVLRRG